MGPLRAAVLAALALALATPLGASVAVASCVQQDAATQIAGAQVIAVGTITETRQTFVAAGGVVRFRPERVLKGNLTNEVQVYLGPTHGGAISSVDYTAVVRGERHTLYLRDAGDGSFETSACSGSHRGEQTPDEERLLGPGTLVAGATDPALSPLTVAAIALVALVAASAVIRVFMGRRAA